VVWEVLYLAEMHCFTMHDDFVSTIVIQCCHVPSWRLLGQRAGVRTLPPAVRPLSRLAPELVRRCSLRRSCARHKREKGVGQHDSRGWVSRLEGGCAKQRWSDSGVVPGTPHQPPSAGSPCRRPLPLPAHPAAQPDRGLSASPHEHLCRWTLSIGCRLDVGDFALKALHTYSLEFSRCVPRPPGCGPHLHAIAQALACELRLDDGDMRALVVDQQVVRHAGRRPPLH
jgi:hypothetical protein